MANRELNRKLAEWAGFQTATKECSKCGLNYEHGHNPEGVGGRSGQIPEFTSSLDACFKWLAPKLEYIRVAWQNTPKVYSEAEVADFTGHRANENFAGSAALALCLAVEKLIEGRLAGSGVAQEKGEA